jgi:hypothetical protein
MLDRTRRLVSGAVDLAKAVVGPAKRVEQAGARRQLDEGPRRRWTAAALVALVGLGVTGCASEKKDEGAAKRKPAGGETAGPGNGRLLIVFDEAGRLASVDPKTGERRDLADVFVERGGLAVRSSGLALFQARGKPDEDGDEEEPDGRLVIVDANGGTAAATIGLKSPGGEYGDGAGDPEVLPIFTALREAGGGKRFVMIPSNSGTLLVNLEKRSAVDLSATFGVPGKFGGQTKFTPDERWGIVNLQEKGLVLFSADDPAKHSAIDGFSPGFSADGKLLFVDKAMENGPGKVWGQPVEGGDHVVFAEGDIRFRGSVGNSVVIAEPSTLYLSSRPGDRRPLDIPYDRNADNGPFVSPIGTGGRGLMFSGSDEEQHWALVDEREAKVTPLPSLDKFTVVNVSEERILFASEYNEDARAASTFALLEVASGTVTPVATWDPAGTNAGPPIASPDGRSVVLSYGREGEQGARSVLIKPGEGVTELNGGIESWAPDGSAVLLVRVVDDKPHMIVVDLATKREKDLGPGYGGVWTQA